MHDFQTSPSAQGVGRPRAADAAIIVLAILACAGVFTWLGPVLKPFLVAVFLFYVAQLGAKTLARFGLGPRMAYASLLAITVILAVLFGQLVSREAAIFMGKWPRYESRMTKVINSLPQFDQMLHGFGNAFLGLPSLAAAIALSVLLVLYRLLWINFVEIRMSGGMLNLAPTLMFVWLSY
ncbi:MAG: hypothetical protein ACKOOF_04185 [Planctomycetaceae bacterium]